MFRKAASAIVPVPTEPGGDAVVNQDAERIEPTPPTSEPEETANEAAAQPKPLRAGSKGWQGHTARAAMTGLRKKGHVIDKRTSGNSTVWFITAGTAA